MKTSISCEGDSPAVSHDYMANFENIIAPGHEPNMTKEYKPQAAYEFEKYLNPDKLKQHVMRSEKIRKIVDHYAREMKCPPRQVEQQIRQILDEIGLERNMAIIRWCGMAITAIGTRICDGIHVNAASMARVKEGLGRNPVLYLPSHRSYMDFILMSYICFHYDIEIPGIAAGMDFHSMFGMGTMLRKTGAFFMRRSFTNDELYWDVFREYMYSLVSAYHIGVEFFIEGTRSRNFKALVPKVGLLSMALLPYFAGDVPDITIVPVSMSYERVLEEQLFVYELLGVPKPKESTKGFFKALKIVEERFGRMYIDFGEPISVRQFFGHTGAERMPRAAIAGHLQTLNGREIEMVKRLANEVIYQQQRRIVLSTFNLLSLFYASQLYAKRSVNIDELARAVVRLKRLFEELGAHVAVNVNSIKPDIIDSVEIHGNLVHLRQARLHCTQVAATQLAQEIDAKRLKAHALRPHTMAIAVPAVSLQLYINPCMFWLARPAYLILAAHQIRAEQQTSSDEREWRHPQVLQLLADRVQLLDDLFKHEFIIDRKREAEEFSRNLNILQTEGVVHIAADTGLVTLEDNQCSRVMLAALAPFLCLYYQLAVALNEFPASKEFAAKDVLIQVQERVERALQDGDKYVHPYCFALDNLNIAIYSYQQHEYLTKDRTSGLLRHSSAKSLRELEQQLLMYCNFLPFEQYYEPGGQPPMPSSKL